MTAKCTINGHGFQFLFDALLNNAYAKLKRQKLPSRSKRLRLPFGRMTQSFTKTAHWQRQICSPFSG
ncbi:hypothetical protein TH30_19510 [Thalassospira profundimaris]|uniref:Uncharacterized protein n=1 Tax=Thalassospira profundimaris TaxID=502049 RepID=A0A367WP70_9PROT|nr:hypothetical protein TH30_19510 [Thalassospira profundimaris]